MSKYVNVGEGEQCPKCGQPMQHREHKQGDTKILKQPFYFREWDYCRPCGHIQHYEHYKVYNKSGERHKTYLQDRQELERQDNFLRHII